MANIGEISPEDLVEQWTFDFYFNKCISDFSLKKNMDDNSKRILQMLMSQSIDVEFDDNRTKANLLIVMDYQQQLDELSLEKFPWSETTELLQSKDMVRELLDLMEGLKNSLSFLDSSKTLKSSDVYPLCKACLLHTYVFMFQISDQLRNAQTAMFKTAQIDSWMKKTLHLLETTVDLAQEKEKKILYACKDLLNGKTEARKTLTQPQDLCDLLAKLVVKVHNECCPRPQLLQLAESYLHVQSKLEERGNGDLLTHRPNSVASLEKLARLNQTKPLDRDKQDSRSRNVKKQSLLKFARSSSNSDYGDRRRDWSRSRSSSRSSTRSSSSDSIATPPKARNSKHSRSRSPRPKVGASKLFQKFREMEEHSKSRKPIDKLPKKPASHARVKLGPWTPAEEEKFVVSVLTIGPGKWQEVKEDIQAVRSTMQLKDKWRNIPKSRIQSIAREHGLSTASKSSARD